MAENPIDDVELDRPCTSEDLTKIALIIGDWKLVGALLNISSNTIKEIDEQETNVRRKKIALLDTWKAKEGKKATYLKLVQVQRHCERQDIVDQIIDIFESSHSSTPPQSSGTPTQRPHQQEYPKYSYSEADAFKVAELKPLVKSAIDKLCTFAENVQVILQTVNDKETLAVLGMMKGPDGEDSKPVNFATVPFKFVLGMFGGYKSAQVKTGMGRSCDEMVKEALQVFPSICAIIMVGVAYGAPRIKAAYGDVLVSKFIHGVQDVKTTPGVCIARPCNTSTVKVHTNLSFTFSSIPNTWGKFVCNKEDDPSKQRHAKVHCGDIISYPNLIADAEFRDKLSHNFPEAIGGEMEGVEVLKITQEYKEKQKKNIGVIIIKGVADFADDEKPSGKQWQFTAAKAAASYAQHKLEMTQGGLFANGDGN